MNLILGTLSKLILDSHRTAPVQDQVSHPMLNSLVVIYFIGWAIGRAHSD